MTVYYSTELASIAATPVVKANVVKAHGARVRRYRATITMAQQTTSDTIVLADIPAGCVFAFGVITASATVGSTATIAIGITGATGKYRAAATHQTANTPTLFGTAATIGATAPLTATETIFVTIAAASLPASGTLVYDLYFTDG